MDGGGLGVRTLWIASLLIVLLCETKQQEKNTRRGAQDEADGGAQHRPPEIRSRW